MTYKQLKKDVVRLGFETGVEDDEALLGAANSALELIYLDRPRIKTVRLFITPIPLLSHREKISLIGRAEEIELMGNAYSFTTVGKGSYTVTDDSGSRVVRLSLGGILHRGRVEGKGTLRFDSEGMLTIFDLCSFDGISDEEEIPLYSAMREIDVTEGKGDLRSFAKAPTDGRGRPVNGALTRGDALLLPWDYVGEIFLDYYRSPNHISGDNDEESIDVSAEMAPLLPLLTAAYIWLDDDSDKAQYYMAMYRQGLSTVMRYSQRAIDEEYRTNGWG